jgi:integrase/recombinase XerD
VKKIRMARGVTFTFEEGCNKYLDNCRARNLREGTINHYRRTYVQFAKFFDMQMLVSEITEEVYQRYVVFLCTTLHNDVSIKIIFKGVLY